MDMERYGSGAGPEHVGKLVKFTSLGCYPVYYIDDGGDVLCADCANVEESEGGGTIIGQDANWENPDLYCAACECRIESAYAEECAP